MAQKPAHRRTRPRLRFGARIAIPRGADPDTARVIHATSTSPHRGRDEARAYLLSRMSKLLPELAALPKRRSVRLWVKRRGLPEWMVGYVRATLALWEQQPTARGRYWSLNSDEQRGERVPESGRQRTPRPEMQVPSWHFDWLSRHLIDRESFDDIAIEPRRKLRAGREADPSGVRKAIRSLTKALE